MPLDTATEPPFRNLAGQVNKIMDQMKGYYSFCPSETWTPNVNLYEIENAYLVCVDLAGVDKEKIEVEVSENRLMLRGTREVPKYMDVIDAHTRIRVHLMEIDHGAFCREVELPADVAQPEIQAEYRNGLLWINLPRR